MIRLADFLAANPDAVVHGSVHADRFAGFCFDSRIVNPGELFLAVKTAKADGHDYIEDACRDGASGVVCQSAVDLTRFGATCVVVPDTEAAIRRYASFVVRDSGVPVVAITGSAGKTTTKEMVAHVLGGRYRVFRNPANYSGRFGLPVALGGLEPGHEIMVLEMSSDQFGEVAMLAEMAPPDTAVVTLVSEAHMSAFGTLDAVSREKGALVASLPSDGLAVLNADDPRVAAMADRTAAPVVSCSVQGATAFGSAFGRYADTDAAAATAEAAGVNRGGSSRSGTDRAGSGGPSAGGSDGNAALAATDVRVTRDGTTFTLHADGRDAPARIPWLGEHFVRSALFAVAVAGRFGLDLDEAVGRLATLPRVPGRLAPVAGLDGSLILDDSYNASPAAVIAGLDVLATLQARKRVAVLGTMAELGEDAEALHRQVGRHAAGVVDVLVTRGREAEWIADEARLAGLAPASVAVTYTTEDAAAAARPHLGEGAVVLCKGSAVSRMEQVVKALMAEPDRAAQTLVRQDAAWQQIIVLQPDRPTWVEIDLGAVAANVRHLKACAGDAEVMAVLKADAYGHGAVQVAHTALRNGATWCGVACLSEAEILRKSGIDAPILVLGYTPAWQAREAVRLGVAVTVYDRDTARALSDAAVALDRELPVHVKVDTGMHRLGVSCEDAPAFLERLHQLPNVAVQGLFTHFAVADDVSHTGRTRTQIQLARFDALLVELDERGLRPPLVHAANSAVLLTYPAARYDLVRPGITMYGLTPSPAIADAALIPALTWKTQVAQLRSLPPGETVGYGGAWRAQRPSRVATIPVGYADGFRRAPHTWRHVLVRGGEAPVVGRVSMDQTTIDVTDIPGVRTGDEVVLIGRQGDRFLSAEAVAGWLGTINYEVVSAILARVPRVS